MKPTNVQQRCWEVVKFALLLCSPLGIWTRKKIIINIHAIGDENARKELVSDLYGELFHGFCVLIQIPWQRKYILSHFHVF